MTNSISSSFNQLGDKEVLGVSFIQDYFEIIFDRGYIRILSEASIKTNDQILSLPSKEGNWHLVSLINEKVLDVTEVDNELSISFANGNEIKVNTKLCAPGENIQIKVETDQPIFI